MFTLLLVVGDEEVKDDDEVVGEVENDDEVAGGVEESVFVARFAGRVATRNTGGARIVGG